LLPDLDRLWTEWWSLNTPGRAVAAVQYVSCLMYPDSENPIFTPWTSDGGGGSPCLWAFAGHLYSNYWLEQNIVFLKKYLNAGTVSSVLLRSIALLADQPEHEVAAQVQADFPLCVETLEARCVELPRFLETTQEATTVFSWSK
jgi:hypothetical protein